MTRPDNFTPSATASAEVSSEVNAVHLMMRFLRMAYYRKGVLIVVLAASCLLGGLRYVTAPRRYESTASLLIRQTGEDTWSTQMSGERVTRDLMATYKSVIRSPAVLEKAIKLMPPEARVDMGSAPSDKWTDVLRDNLIVSDERGTSIMHVAYRSADPRAAACSVSSVVTAFLDWVEREHGNDAGQRLDRLDKDKGTLAEQLRAIEAKIARTRAAADEVVIRKGDQGANLAVESVFHLKEEVMEARKTRMEAQIILDAIEREIHSGGNLRRLTLSIVFEPGNKALLQQLGLGESDGDTLATLKRQLVADTAALQTESTKYGPANPKIWAIQQRILVNQQALNTYRENAFASLQRIGDRELGEILQGYARQQLNQAVERELAIAGEYDKAVQHEKELRGPESELESLNHERERLQAMFDSVLEQIKHIGDVKDAGALRASVISRPEVPVAPVSPRLRMTAIESILLGLLVGLGLVYVLDVLDDRFRSPEDLQLQLRVPVLAMVRKLEGLEGDGLEKLHVVTQPNGSASEAFRTLRTALALTGGGAKSFVISSAEPGDGKTTTMANLAAAFAQTGQRTLLIDGDMRRPGLTSLLDLRGATGLATVLRDDAPIAESAAANLETTSLENLHILPSGPRQTNSMQLLASERFSELLSWADSCYDQILVDAPPALAVSDAAMIGRLVDGVLLIVRPEKNRRRTVIRAVEHLRMLGVNVIGTVLNHLAPEKDSHYYGYSYGYGYGYEYGGEYGHDESGDDEDSLDAADPRGEAKIRPRKKGQRKAA